MSSCSPAEIRGLVCPMVTACDAGGNLDLSAARRAVDFLIAHGVQVLFPAGSTGEGPLLSAQERMELAAAVDQALLPQGPALLCPQPLSHDSSAHHGLAHGHGISFARERFG